MPTWIQVLIDLVKALPLIIGLVKEILQIIHGSESKLKPDPIVVKSQVAAFKMAAKSARQGDHAPLLNLMDKHLGRRRK